jgi:phosphoribosylformimino-5-aminoimidazole carboxamide ribotide isomerase
MRCVAVIDLKDGLCVHAVRGDRASYRPVRSCLTPSAQPIEVVAALREQLGVTAFYVADLDAIQRRGSSRALIERLVERHADCNWWIDAGFGHPADLGSYLAAPQVDFVIGSESLATLADYGALLAALPDPTRALLSLDRRLGRFIGPPALWATASLWPATVIAMNLDRVGADAGPDLTLIQELRTRAPGRAIVAAGGVRDAGDLDLLAAAGASHVLLASALHAGRIGPEELEQHR